MAGSFASGGLYFAGEATNFEGYHGTVDGAMASGVRAAAEALQIAGRLNVA